MCERQKYATIEWKKKVTDSVQLCRFLVKSKQCEYYNNYQSLSNSKGGANSGCGGGGGSNIVDIEDLVKSNARRKVCPYYLSRELAPNANLVRFP